MEGGGGGGGHGYGGGGGGAWVWKGHGVDNIDIMAVQRGGGGVNGFEVPPSPIMATSS